MRKIYIKKGIELSKDEIEEINRAKAREFKIPPMPEEKVLSTPNKEVLLKRPFNW